MFNALALLVRKELSKSILNCLGLGLSGFQTKNKQVKRSVPWLFLVRQELSKSILNCLGLSGFQKKNKQVKRSLPWLFFWFGKNSGSQSWIALAFLGFKKKQASQALIALAFFWFGKNSGSQSWIALAFLGFKKKQASQAFIVLVFFWFEVSFRKELSKSILNCLGLSGSQKKHKQVNGSLLSLFCFKKTNQSLFPWLHLVHCWFEKNNKQLNLSLPWLFWAPKGTSKTIVIRPLALLVRKKQIKR